MFIFSNGVLNLTKYVSSFSPIALVGKSLTSAPLTTLKICLGSSTLNKYRYFPDDPFTMLLLVCLNLNCRHLGHILELSSMELTSPHLWSSDFLWFASIVPSLDLEEDGCFLFKLISARLFGWDEEVLPWKSRKWA